ncbi:MAG: hypothetical protein HQL88_11190 [Magnetococcales bacterium]|nr:hypothetical protein [Magnetococcales bacterium]
MNGNSFLERCDPRAKLIALLLFLPFLMAQPVLSWGWGVGVMGVVVLLLQSGPTELLPSLLRQLWRLRWLFATLLLLHGCMTPGEPVGGDWPLLTWEGLREGGEQTARLMVLVSLSWALVRTTTPLHWVIGLYRLFRGLERLQVPVKAGCALVAFALGCIPRLLQESHRVGEDMALRLPPGVSRRWLGRLQRTAWGGEALLYRLLSVARSQEEALSARGMTEGLPFVAIHETPLGWRDLLLLSLPVLLFLGVRLF